MVILSEETKEIVISKFSKEPWNVENSCVYGNEKERH